MPKLSKRRLEVLASYGIFPKQEIDPAPPKPTKKKGRPPKPKPVELHAHLPKNSPIRIQRELEMEGIDTTTAKQDAKNSKQKVLNTLALRTKQSRKRHKPVYRKNERHLVNNLHLDGLLSASSAKKGTVDKPSIAGESSAPFYNYKDNFIEEQHHGKASAYDPRFIDLIEIQDSGKMIWHGDTCAICTMPPSTVGEVMLAQYGEASFVCTDCGKLVEDKGLGMRGWIFAQVKNFKRHKVKQLQKYHIPIDEEEYAV